MQGWHVLRYDFCLFFFQYKYYRKLTERALLVYDSYLKHYLLSPTRLSINPWHLFDIVTRVMNYLDPLTLDIDTFASLCF